jgi:hypothetical protein
VGVEGVEDGEAPAEKLGFLENGDLEAGAVGIGPAESLFVGRWETPAVAAKGRVSGGKGLCEVPGDSLRVLDGAGAATVCETVLVAGLSAGAAFGCLLGKRVDLGG